MITTGGIQPDSAAAAGGGSESCASVRPEEREFHTKEWEFLRSDIRSQIEQSKYLEFATTIALGAFYAWFTTDVSQAPRFLLFIPMLLVFLAALRSYATLTYIQRSARYVRTLETALSANNVGLIGWDRTRDKQIRRVPILKLSAGLFWLLALAITIAAWWAL